MRILDFLSVSIGYFVLILKKEEEEEALGILSSLFKRLLDCVVYGLVDDVCLSMYEGKWMKTQIRLTLLYRRKKKTKKGSREYRALVLFFLIEVALFLGLKTKESVSDEV